MEGLYRRVRRDATTFALLGAMLCSQACVPEPVRWDVEQGEVPAAIEPWTPRVAPTDAPICAASLVAARARGDTGFAAWWSPRSDGSVALVVSRSDDGGRSWRPPEVADSTDRGHTGCARPPPFLAADSSNGYAHLVYFLVAPEGPGVFFTHSMAGGAMFHAPVPIVYGERVSAAAVASRGDTLAVAYENPNAAVPQVWLALSHSTGHIFEQRVSVSSANVTATRPSVALNGPRVAVSWLETARSGGATTVVVRRGTLRW